MIITDKATSTYFRKRYPSLYQKIRNEVKKERGEHARKLVEKKNLPCNIETIRFAEYITNYAITRLKREYPAKWSKAKEAARKDLY